MVSWIGLRIAATGVSLAVVAACGASLPPVPGPEGASWPDPHWQRYVVPEDAGFSGAGLAAAEARARMLGSAAVMVVYDGAVVAAWGDIDRRFACHSIRKSLLSSLYGIRAIDRSQTLAALGIDDSPYPLTEAEKQATVGDLLASRSGVYLPPALADPYEDLRRPARGSYPPGSHFYYNNWDFNVLATLYEKVTGGRLFEDFDALVARPIGMERFRVRDGYYHYEREFSTHPGYPFKLATRDLARFGWLYAQGGEWSGRQVVPAGWAWRSTSTVTDLGGGQGYAYLWWTSSDGTCFEGRGFGGHGLIVCPRDRLLFVHRTDTWKGASIRHEDVHELFRQVLGARTGSPAAHPRLEPLAPPREPRAAVSTDELGAWVGRYGFEGAPATPDAPAFDPFVAAVTRQDGHLVLEIPVLGNFDLVARSGLEFEVDDLGRSGRFDPGGPGAPARLWVGPYSGARLP